VNDPELNAISEVTKALADLSDDQRRNVLLYINARYGGQVTLRPHVGTAAAPESPAPEVGQYASLGDFFDAANPQTESERVLVVAYWASVVEGASDFESFSINQRLKNLGHPVSNITRALDTLIDQLPRFVLQTAKSGSSKQARKKYKVTREGTKRVQAMLVQANGEGNGD
jgi:hypothetical protein